MHHERGNDIGEALFDHKIPGICQNGFMQAGNIPKQVIEPIARHTAVSYTHLDVYKRQCPHKPQLGMLARCLLPRR